MSGLNENSKQSVNQGQAAPLMMRAVQKETVNRPPIWLMRQAGRFQPEYRAIREKVGFLELCKTPDLAAEVALRSVEQLGVDAAILFSDILVLLEPLGAGVFFDRGEGPRIEKPIRTVADVDVLIANPDIEHELGYVAEALKRTRKGLAPEFALIGFAGAPFTLASYLIEGGGSKDFLKTKLFMHQESSAWHRLMEILANVTIRYAKMQHQAGAQVFQLFDSWVGALSVGDYREFVLPHLNRLIPAIEAFLPTIYFSTGNPALYKDAAATGASVLGIDHRAELPDIAAVVGDVVGLQGNLDSALLLGPERRMFERTHRLLNDVARRPGYIFNLGHGVLPPTEVSRVSRLVDFVKRWPESAQEQGIL